MKNFPLQAAATIALIALVAYVAFASEGSPGVDERFARVIRVIDGDTVVAELAPGESVHVRLIGIDTPEIFHDGRPAECYATRAAGLARRLAQGREVLLERGREANDRYGRVLAYVQVRGEPDDLEHALLQAGAARTLAIPPNIDRAAGYAEVERAARRAGRGLWGACPAE